MAARGFVTSPLSHSDKQAAAGTYKGGFGFHPLMACLDATGECLAGVGRSGNTGSNTATDHFVFGVESWVRGV